MKITCRDCGREVDAQRYRLQGFEVQYPNEGICEACLEDRIEEGETLDDIIAEFCG